MVPNTLAPGTRLAHFEIVGRLGAGGMGEVYRAHDTSLDRDVAIKVLSSQLADNAEMGERFVREARAVAALSHPNILSIYELGCVDGLSFAVMELLEGESLRDRIARGPLPWRTAVNLGARAAEGLAAAHAKGVVHRDIKPENLFVQADGSLKVLDFGLARWTHAGAAGALKTTAVLTQPRALLGSMGYIAPEQVLGEPAGPPADIFALGCVIYEMVTGQRAFQGETPTETMAAILRASPPPMSERAPDAPPALERIVAHCLVRNPTARFSNASDVTAALRALAVDSAISSKVPTRPGKARSAQRSVAVLPFAYSGEPDGDYLADGLTESVINSLSQVPGLRVVPRSTAFQFKGRDLDIPSVALALNVRSIVTGRVVRRAEVVTIQAELVDAETQGQVWGHQYRYSMAEVLAFEDEVAEQIAKALNVRFSHDEVKRLRRRQTLDTKAYHEYLRGRHQWSRWTPEGVMQAIGHFERAIDADPTFALAWSGLADALILAGYYSFIAPADGMARGMQAARRALDLDPTLAEAHAAIGFALLFSELDWEGAEAATRRAVEINPRLAVGHAYLGLVLGYRGRRSEAISATQRACDLEPFSLVTRLLRGWVLWQCGEYEASRNQAQRLLARDEGCAEAHAMSIMCLEALGRLDLAADEWALGVAVFSQGQDRDGRLKTALATRGPTGYWEERLALARGASDSTNGLARLAQALALAALGRLTEGLEVLDEIVTAHMAAAAVVGVVPFLHSYQAHPEYSALLERVGLSISKVPTVQERTVSAAGNS